MDRRYKVVMLPTDEATELVYDTWTAKYRFDNKLNREYVKFQHLYIVDTKVIVQSSDWALNASNNYLHSVAVKPHKSALECGTFHIIVASTDTSLGLYSIPESFIKAYIDNPTLTIQNLSLVCVSDAWSCEIQWDNLQEDEYDALLIPKTQSEFILGYNKRLKDRNSCWVFEGKNPFDSIDNFRVAEALQDYIESLGVDNSDDFGAWADWFQELPYDSQ